MSNTEVKDAKKFSRIMLVDDHTLFRQGLKFLLADLESDIAFYEADNCEKALEFATNTTIDLILLDYHFPGGASEHEALKQIKHAFEDTTVVVLSSEDNPQIIIAAIDGGAAGFIPKSSTPEIMIAALKLVLAGGIYLPPNAPTVFQKSPQLKLTEGSFAELTEQLTERQLETLMGAIKGKPNKIIARELNIAEGTVKAHLSVAFRVLDVKNRTEAVFLAAQLGLKS